MTYLSFEQYTELVQKLNGGHWTKATIATRWDYHLKAIELIKSLEAQGSRTVLEMGTMGVKCVAESDTIDFLEKWDFEGKQPTYPHDCRNFPWPVETGSYDVFVSLRVFQHLQPVQKEAFLEAKRIARNVIIVVPRAYNNQLIPDSKPITYKDFLDFNGGVHPNVFLPTKFGDLYLWCADNPSSLNIENLFKDINQDGPKTKVVTEYVGIGSLFIKLYRRLRK
ncbi:MAG: hypothetical protein ACKOZM_04635 [Flavobacteriales bacterium]